MTKRKNKSLIKKFVMLLLVLALFGILIFTAFATINSPYATIQKAKAAGYETDTNFKPSSVGDFLFFKNGVSTLDTLVNISRGNGFKFTDDTSKRKFTYHHYHGFMDTMSEYFVATNSYNGNDDTFGGYLSGTNISSHTINIYAYIKLDPSYVKFIKAGTLALSTSSVADIGASTDTDQELAWGLSLYSGNLATATDTNPFYGDLTEFQNGNNMGYSLGYKRTTTGVLQATSIAKSQPLVLAADTDENNVYIRVAVYGKTTSTLFRDYSPFIQNIKIKLQYNEANILVGKKGVGGTKGGDIGNVTATVSGVPLGVKPIAKTLAAYDSSVMIQATDHIGYNFIGWYASDVTDVKMVNGVVTNATKIAADSYDTVTKTHSLTITAYDHKQVCTDPNCKVDHAASHYAESNKYYFAVYSPKTFAIILHGEGGLFNNSPTITMNGYFDEAVTLVNGDKFKKENSGFAKWFGDKYVNGVVNGTVEYLNFSSATHFIGYMSSADAIASSGGRFSYAATEGKPYDLHAIWGGGDCSNTDDIAPYVIKDRTEVYEGYVTMWFRVASEKPGHTLSNMFARYASNVTNTQMAGKRVQLEKEVTNGVTYFKLPYLSGAFSASLEWQANTYTINYNDITGWTMPQVVINSYFSGEVITAEKLPVPSKANFLFLGWSETVGGTPINGIAASDFGNKNLYLIGRDVSNNSADSDAANHIGKINTASLDTWKTTGGKHTSVNSKSGIGIDYSGQETSSKVYLYNTVYIGGALGVALRQGKTVTVFATATIALGGKGNWLFNAASGKEYGNASIWDGDNTTAYLTANQHATGVNAAFKSTTSWQVASEALQTGSIVLDKNSKSFTIGCDLELQNSTLFSPSSQYAIVTSLTYTVTVVGDDGYTITYVVDKDSQKVSFVSKSSAPAPWIATTKEYYEFIGWSATEHATSALYKVGETITTTSDLTLYAVWQAKNYTVLTYDVFFGADKAEAGDISYVRKIRYPHYKTYGVEYSLNDTVADIEQLHTHSGFVKYKGSGLPTNWYTTFNEYQNIIDGLLTQTATLTGNVASIAPNVVNTADKLVVFAYWKLDAPTVANGSGLSANSAGKKYIKVDYGTSINLDELVAITHSGDISKLNYLYNWYKGTGANYNTVTFYGLNHILYDADESNKDNNDYRAAVTAVFSEGDITLRSTEGYNGAKNTAQFTATIQPLNLRVARANEDLSYNGNKQDVSMALEIDTDYYTNRQKTDNLGVAIVGSYYTVDEIGLMKAVLAKEAGSTKSYYEAEAKRGGLFTYHLLYHIPYYNVEGRTYVDGGVYSLSDAVKDGSGNIKYRYIPKDTSLVSYYMFAGADGKIVYAMINGEKYLYDSLAPIIDGATACTRGASTVYVKNVGTEGVTVVSHYALTTEIKNAGRYMVSNLSLKRSATNGAIATNTPANLNYIWTNSVQGDPQCTREAFEFTVKKIQSSIVIYDFEKIYDGTANIPDTVIENFEITPEATKWNVSFINVLNKDFLTDFKAYLKNSIIIESATFQSGGLRYLVEGKHIDSEGNAFYVISIKWAANQYADAHYFLQNNYSFTITNTRNDKMTYDPIVTNNDIDNFAMVDSGGGDTIYKNTSTNPTIYNIPSWVGRFYVKPINLVIDWATGSGLIYDGTAQGIRATIKAVSGGIVSADTEGLYLSYARTKELYAVGGANILTMQKEATGVGGINTITYFFSAVDAGDYSVYIGGVSDGNYILSQYQVDIGGGNIIGGDGKPLPADYSGKWSIGQRQLKTSWRSSDSASPNNFSLTYNALAQGVTFTIGNIIYSETIANRDYVTLNKITLSSNAIVTALTTATQISASKKDTAVTTASVGYNDDYNFMATNCGAYAVEIVGVSASNKKNTAPMTAITTSSFSANYIINGALSRDFEIKTYKLANANIVADTSVSYVYDGNAHTLLFHLVGVAGQEVRVTAYNNNTAINAGSYIAEALAIDNTNYSLAAEGVTFVWKITPRPLTLQWTIGAGSVNNIWTYDGEYHGVSVSLGNIVGQGTVADKISLSITHSGERVSNVNNLGNGDSISFSSINANGAQYTASLTAVINTLNYELPTSNTTYSYGVQKRNLTISWDYTTAGAAIYTYDATAHGAIATIGNVVSRDAGDLAFDAKNMVSLKTPSRSYSINGAAATITLVFEETNVYYLNGQYLNYTAKILAVLSDNYAFNTGSVLSKEFLIDARSIQEKDIGYGSTTFVYDGARKTIEVTINNKAGADKIYPILITSDTLSGAVDIAAINAGVYYTIIVGLNGNDNHNYMLANRYAKELTITKRLVNFSWALTAGASGGIFGYDGALHGASLTISNVISTDTIGFTTTDGVVTNVASAIANNQSLSILNRNVRVDSVKNSIDYDIKVTALDNNNYYLPSNNGTTYKITPRKLTIDNTNGWVYSSPNVSNYIYDGKAHGVTVNIGNIVSGDTPQIKVYSSGAIPNVDSNGYAVITPTSPLTAVYTAQISFGAINYSPSAYSARVVAVNDNNYILPLENLEKGYTIAQRELHFEWRFTSAVVGGGWTYDGLLHGLELIVGASDPNTQIVNGDSVYLQVNGSGLIVTPSAVNGVVGALQNNGKVTFSAKDYGSYSAQILALTSSTNNNYKLSSGNLSANFNILKKGITVEWSYAKEDSANKGTMVADTAATGKFVYDGALRGRCATISGIVVGDTITFSASGSGKYRSALLSNGLADKWYIYFGDSEANASDYTASVSATNSANYSIVATSASYHIGSREVGVSYSFTSALPFIYNGGQQGVTVTVSNIVAGDSVTFVATTNGSYPALVNNKVEFSSNASASVTQTFSAINSGDSYYAEIKEVKNSNYVLPTTGLLKNWSIGRRQVTITWAPSGSEWTGFTIPYNRTERRIDATLGNLVVGDTVNPNIINNYATDAGSYNAEVIGFTGSASGNYALPTVTTQTFTIAPKNVGLNWQINGAPYTGAVNYNGKPYVMTVTVTGVIEGDSIGVVYVNDGVYYSQGTNATSYTAKATIERSQYPNYTIEGNKDTFNWVIAPLQLVISWVTPVNLIYNGSEQGNTMRISGILPTEKITLNLTKPSGYTKPTTNTVVSSGNTSYVGVEFLGINAGDYGAAGIASVTDTNGAVNGNYILPTQELTHNMAIAKRTISIKWSAESAFVYDGTAHRVVATVTNAVGGDSVSVFYNDPVGGVYEKHLVIDGNQYYKGSYATNAGYYFAMVTGINGNLNNNYCLPQGGATLPEKLFSVAKRTVTVSYQTAADLTYNGAGQGVSVIFSNIVNADKALLSYIMEVGVERRGAAATTSNTTINFADCTVINGDFVTITYKFKHIDAGKYIVKLLNTAPSGSSNYVYSANSPSEYTISPKTLAILWTGDGINSPALVYSNGVFTTTYSAVLRSVFATVDDASIVMREDTGKKDVVHLQYAKTSVNSATNAGRYTAIVGATDNANYIIPTDNSSRALAIEKAIVGISWSGDSASEYDGRTKQVSAQAISGIFNGDKVNITLFNGVDGANYYTSSAINSGNYMAKAIATDNLNYGIATGEVFNWVINARTVTIVFGALTMEYDGSVKTLSATVGNAVSGDTVTLTVTNNKEAKNAGLYTATVSAIANNPNNNYKLPTVRLSQDFTITAREVRIVWDYTTPNTSSYIYDAATHGAIASVTRIIVGDILNFTVEKQAGVAVSGLTVNNADRLAITFSAINYLSGGYTVKIIGVDNTNYAISPNNTAKFNIEARELILSYVNSSGSALNTYVYDGAAHGVALTVGNIVGKDTVTLEFNNTQALLITGNVGIVNGGAVTITAVNYLQSAYSATVIRIASDVANNYKLPSSGLNATFTITQREISVKWTGGAAERSFVYDGATHGISVTFDNIIASDNLAFGYDTNAIHSAQAIASYIKDTLTIQPVSYSFNAINYSINGYSVTINAILGDTNHNYKLQQADRTSSFVIEKRLLTVAIGVSSPSPYDGLLHGVAMTIGNIIGQDKLAFGIYTDGVKPASGNSIFSITGSPNATYSASIDFSAIDSGDYTVRVDSVASSNYALPTVGLEGHFSIAKRLLNLAFTLDNRSQMAVVYDGASHILKVSATNLVGGDKISLAISGNTATNSGLYTAKVENAVYKNYELPSLLTCDYTIEKRAITATSQVEYTYKAEQYLAKDILITFTNTVNQDKPLYALTFGGAGLTNGYPINVGSYTVSVALDSSVVNYTLTNAETALNIAVIPYVISKNSLSFEETLVDTSNNSSAKKPIDSAFPMVYVNGTTYHNLSVSAVNDAIFTLANAGASGSVGFSYHHFGLCTCGNKLTTSPTEEEKAHQWLLDSSGNLRSGGAMHAGTYWLVMSLTGASSGNFVFDGGDDGYNDSKYFEKYVDSVDSKEKVRFKYPSSGLEAIGSLPTAGKYVLKYVINQKVGAFTGESSSNISKVFDGGYYRDAPIISGSSDSDVSVFINGQQYTLSGYKSNTKIRNVAEYTIDFVSKDATGGGGASSCDLISGTLTKATRRLTITPATLFVTNTAAVPYQKTYDATTNYTAFSISGIINSAYASVIASYATAAATTQNITFEVVGEDKGNYQFSIKIGGVDTITNNVSGAIIPREITVINVSSDNWNKVYDGTAIVSNFSIRSGDILAVAPASVTAEYNSASAGAKTITFTISGENSGNYVVKVDTDINPTINAVIFKKGLTITSNNAVKVYDGLTSAEGLYQINGGINGDIIVATGEFDSQLVGKNKVITISLSNDSRLNYKFNGDGAPQEQAKDTATMQGEITKRELALLWTDTRLHNVYNGALQGVSLVISNIVSGDDISIGANASGAGNYAEQGLTLNRRTYNYNQIAANKYTIDVTLDTATAVNSNYIIARATHYEWVIAKRKIAISWQADSLGAWDNNFATVYNAKLRTVAPSITTVSGDTESGAIASDNLVVTAIGNSATGVGNYTASASVANANYAIVLGDSLSYSIIKATISGITLNNKNTIYNGAAQALAVSGSVTTLGDSVAIVYKIWQGGLAPTAGNSAKNNGRYNVTATITNANYITAELTAELFIDKAQIDGVTMDGINTKYSNSEYNLAVSALVSVYGDKLTVVYSGGENATQNGATNAGKYTITAVLSSENYYDKSLSAILVIEKADIVRDGVFSDKIVTYCGDNVSLELTGYSAFTQYGDTIKVEYMYNSAVALGVKNAGVYTVIATLNAYRNNVLSANYNQLTYRAQLTIERATMVNAVDGGAFYFNSAAITYDTIAHYLAILTSGNGNFVADTAQKTISVKPSPTSANIDIATISFSVGGAEFFGAKDAGQYALTATIANSNYVTQSLQATLTINKVDITNIYLNGYEKTYQGQSGRFSIGVSLTAKDVVYDKINTINLLGADTATVTYSYSLTQNGAYTPFDYVTNACNAYYIKASIVASGSNYNEKTLTATIKIAKADINNITISNKTTAYNGAAQEIAVVSKLLSGSAVSGQAISAYGEQLSLTYTITDIATHTALSANSATNAGNYSVSAQINAANANANYMSSEVYATLTINKAEILNGVQIKSVGGGANEARYVYDKERHTIILIDNNGTEIATSLQGSIIVKPQGNSAYLGDTVSVRFVLPNGAAFSEAVNVGSYFVTVTIDDKNYVKFEAVVTLIIDKATIATDVYFGVNGAETVTYDTLSYYLTIRQNALDSVVTRVSGDVIRQLNISPVGGSGVSDTASISYVLGGASFEYARNAGSYTVTARMYNDNYITKEWTVTLNISKYSLGNLYFVGGAITYDALSHQVAVSNTNNYSGTPYTSVTLLNGDGVATINYKYNTTGSAQYISTFSYAKQAASYYIEATISADNHILSNYSYATTTAVNDEFKLYATYTINKAPLNIFLTGTTATYKADKFYLFLTSTDVYYSGNVAPTINLLGGDGAVMANYSYATVAGGAVSAFNGALNAGAYYISATLTNPSNILANYDVEALYRAFNTKEPTSVSGALKATLIINKANVPTKYFVGNNNLVFNNKPYYIGLSDQNEYNGNPTSTVKLLYSEVATVAYTYNTDGSAVYNSVFNGAVNAGAYYVRATLSASGEVLNNYNIGTSYTATIVVNKVKFDGTVNNLNKLYFVGATIDYDSYTHTLGVNIASSWLDNQSLYSEVTLVDNQKAQFKYTTRGGASFVSATNADNYIINATLTAVGATNLDNYDLASLYGAGASCFEATLAINKVNANLIWKTNGATNSFVYTGIAQSSAIGAEFVGVGGDGVVQLAVAIKGGYGGQDTVFKNAGDYLATVNFDAYKQNYNLAGAVNMAYTIKKATINYKMAGYTIDYNGVMHYLGVHPTDAIKNDDINATKNIQLLQSDTATLVYNYNTDGGAIYNTQFGGAVNAGVYYVKATLTNADNAMLFASNYEEWTAVATLIINKITIGTASQEYTKVYDGTTTVNVVTENRIVAADIAYIELSTYYKTKNVGVNKTVVFKLVAKTGVDSAIANAKIANYILYDVTNGVITAKELKPSPTLYTEWRKEYDGFASSNNGNKIVLDDNFGVIRGENITVTAQYNSKNVAEANIILFTISGEGANNYVMANITVGVSITKATAVTIWNSNSGSGYQFTYSGKPLEITAHIGLLGGDITVANGGRHDLTITLTSGGVSVANMLNAGKYTATATTNNAAYNSNYSITNTSADWTITPKQVTVKWDNLQAEYTYNAKNQGVNITAYMDLLQSDATASNNGRYNLQVVFYRATAVAQFINAGDYTAEASIGDTVFNYANNYQLTLDITRNLTIKKASVTNAVFNTLNGKIITDAYYTGVSHYYYVALAGGAVSYVTHNPQPIYYMWEEQNGTLIKMDIVYSGGDTSDSAINSGNNGCKNAGAYKIYARVAETENYERWADFIEVSVPKGDASNYIFFNGVGSVVNGELVSGTGIPYNGMLQSAYASNKNEFSSIPNEIKYPDNTTATVTYQIIGVTDGETVYRDGNSARNAGIYLVKATLSESSNYNAHAYTSVYFCIAKVDKKVMWLANNITPTAFIYNNKDQAATIVSYINSVGGDGVNGKIALEFAIKSVGDLQEYHNHGGKDGEFRLAGNYLARANFINGADSEYYRNYTLQNADLALTIQKFSLLLKWEIGNEVKGYNVYNELSVYEYDGTAYKIKVTAYGLVINDAGGRETLPIILPSGADDPYLQDPSILHGNTYGVQSTNAGIFMAVVKAIDNTSYDYSYNYKLPSDMTLLWEIQKRNMSLNFYTQNISKIYDGSEFFTTSLKNYVLEYDLNGYRKVTFTYNVASAQGYITFALDNIILNDEESIIKQVGIKEIAANASNVTATAAIVTFSDFVHSNYYITLDGQSTLSKALPAEIKPRDITLDVSNEIGHIYNGKTFSNELLWASNISTIAGTKIFNKMYDYDGVTAITKLIDGNCFIGTISLIASASGNNYDAGKYAYDIKNLHTEDKFGAQNYKVNIVPYDTKQYTISKRGLAFNYQNTLQSLQSGSYAPVSINGVADGETNDKQMTQQEFIELMKRDGILTNGGAINSNSYIITNGWLAEAAAITAYKRYLGGENRALLYVELASGVNGFDTRNASNYNIKQPILQITYLRLADAAGSADSYTFKVTNASDLLHLAQDVAGLLVAYGYNWGVKPTYIQTADIDMINGSGYGIFKTVYEFNGTYDGKGHTIHNLTIVAQNTLGGFVGILNGVIKDVAFRNATINAYNAEYVGGVAAIMENGTLSGITFQGEIYASSSGATNRTNVGGLIGLLRGSGNVLGNTNASFVVGDIYTDSQGFVGGVVGKIESLGVSGAKYNIAINSVNTFVKIICDNKLVTANAVIGSPLSAFTGTEVTVTVTNCTHLASAINLAGEVVEGAACGLAATYSDMTTSAINLLSTVNTYVIKEYYVGSAAYATLKNADPSDNAGTVNNPFKVTNWRQLSLLEIYSFADFSVKNDIVLPMSQNAYPSSVAIKPSSFVNNTYFGATTFVAGARIKANIGSDVTRKMFVNSSVIIYNIFG